MKVLVADDDRDFATIMALTLRATWPSCVVTVAGDGAQASRRSAATWEPGGSEAAGAMP